MFNKTKYIFCATLLLYVQSVHLGAQSTPTSQISGVIQDSTGAAIPDAKVTVVNTDTAATRSVSSEGDGAYTFTNLVAGPYRLVVVKEGFETYNQSGIVLQVDSNPKINVTLVIGTVSQQVQVNSNASMVETQSVGVGQVIDQKRIVDLPLNGRNAAELITLSGAAVSGTPESSSGVATSPTGLVNNLDYPTVSAFAVAGGQANATNYFLDGGTYLDVRTNVGLPLPFPDALQEFQVETSSLPANYGNLAGGAVSAVTKSGTNSLHGGVFEFLRNGVFDARNYFAPVRDSLKRNQFGGEVGGPVLKDKVFFFGGFQGTTERTAPATNTAYVPTAAVLNGDFATVLSTTCQPKQETLLPDVSYDGIHLKPGVMNPVALKFLSLLPVSTDPCGKLLYGIPTDDNEFQGVTREDWQRNAKDSLFFRLFITDYALKPIYTAGNLLTAANPGLANRVTAANIGDTYLINSRAVSAFRFTYSRSAVQRVGAGGVPTMTELGADVTSPIKNYTGQIFNGSYFTLSSIPGYIFTNVFGVSEDVNLTRGAHQISLGFYWQHTRMNALGPFQQNPRLTFTGQLTGNTEADFITGNVDTFLQGNGQVGDDVQQYPSLYAQDNWKVTSRFQLNAGLRWDPFIPQKQLLGYASNFSLPEFVANQVSSVYVNAPPGLTFPGDKGFNGKSDTFPRYGDVAPRVGLLYDPSGKGSEIFRAGYGVFFSNTYLWQTMHVPLNAPWGDTISLSAPPGGLSNPWSTYPGGNPFPTPVNPPTTTSFPFDAAYVFEPQHVHATSMQQWNLAFQKQIASDWLVSATYLGNLTLHQWLGAENNPAVYSPGATTATTEKRRKLILAYPDTGKYFGSTIIITDNTRATYNGLLLAANHRFSKNFSVLANYTWSHCLNEGENDQDIANLFQNPANPKGDWGNCALDFRQLFNASVVAQSPQFASRWVRLFASNWSLSGIFTDHSGQWSNVTDGVDVSLTGLGEDRPNLIGQSKKSDPTIHQWFNTGAYEHQAPGTFGDTGRNTVVGPEAWDLDMGLWRRFQITERLGLDARAEAFNILNHTQLNVPVTSMSASNFGQVISAQNPRILQLAVKLSF